MADQDHQYQSPPEKAKTKKQKRKLRFDTLHKARWANKDSHIEDNPPDKAAKISENCDNLSDAHNTSMDSILSQDSDLKSSQHLPADTSGSEYFPTPSKWSLLQQQSEGKYCPFEVQIS